MKSPLWDAREQLIETIENERVYGRVVVAFDEHCATESDYGQVSDAFLIRQNYSPLGQKRHEIGRVAANEHLQTILERDSAYRGNIMPKERAAELAAAFLALFDEDAFFVTNCALHPGHRWMDEICSWTPISQATFDTGVVAIDRCHIGIVWTEDED